MKSTENLVIVDVAATGGFERIHFEGAINIPEISYIDGSPLFDEYNNWFADNR